MENLVLVLTISPVDRSNYASTDFYFFYRLAKFLVYNVPETNDNYIILF